MHGPVTPNLLQSAIARRTPPGLYLGREGRRWVAVDNSTGEAWTEDFERIDAAICWLLRTEKEETA